MIFCFILFSYQYESNTFLSSFLWRLLVIALTTRLYIVFLPWDISWYCTSKMGSTLLFSLYFWKILSCSVCCEVYWPGRSFAERSSSHGSSGQKMFIRFECCNETWSDQQIFYESDGEILFRLCESLCTPTWLTWRTFSWRKVGYCWSWSLCRWEHTKVTLSKMQWFFFFKSAIKLDINSTFIP